MFLKNEIGITYICTKSARRKNGVCIPQSEVVIPVTFLWHSNYRDHTGTTRLIPDQKNKSLSKCGIEVGGMKKA